MQQRFLLQILLLASNKICNKNLCCIQLAFYFHILTTMHGQNNIKFLVIQFSPLLLFSNIFLGNLFSKQRQPISSLNVSYLFHTHRNNKPNCYQYIFEQETGRRKILHRMIASVPKFSLLLTFQQGNLVCQGFSQIFEMLRSFKWFITYLQVVILSCILISRYDHLIRFLSIYFQAGLPF